VSCTDAAQQEFNRAMALFHSFWFDHAKRSFAKVLELDPDFTIERVAKSTIAFKRDEDAENCFEGMRRAGLPEG